MYITVLLISLLLAIVFIICIVKTPEDKKYSTVRENGPSVSTTSYDLKCIALTVCGILILTCTIFCYKYIEEIAEIKTTKEQIVILEQANIDCENEIADIVEQYQNYEITSYKNSKIDVSNTNILAIAQAYPELKSDKLVQQQINTIKQNKEEIVELQKKAAEEKKIKFLLYFG